MDPFAQISGESNGPWVKGRDSEGLLWCSMTVIQHDPLQIFQSDHY